MNQMLRTPAPSATLDVDVLRSVVAIAEGGSIAAASARVARTPAASCVLMGFEEGNLRYNLRYFLTNLQEDDLTDSMVRVHLFASLQRAGIRIAEPQRTVHAVARDQAHAETLEQALADAYLINPVLNAERARLRAVDEQVGIA